MAVSCVVVFNPQPFITRPHNISGSRFLLSHARNDTNKREHRARSGAITPNGLMMPATGCKSIGRNWHLVGAATCEIQRAYQSLIAICLRNEVALPLRCTMFSSCCRCFGIYGLPLSFVCYNRRYDSFQFIVHIIMLIYFQIDGPINKCGCKV